MRPRSATIADQMHTLDKILPVVAQLEQKGENTNTQQMRRTILSKFNDRIQRISSKWKLRFKICEGPWKTNERETEHSNAQHVDKTARSANNRSIRTFPCFYCNDTNHTPRSCPKYTTIEQRLEVIKRRNLCHNCGSGDHRAKDCTGGACRQCNEKGHHTSICRKAPKPQAWTPKPARNALPKAQPEAPAPKKKAVSQNFAAVVANQSSTSCRIGDHVVLRQQDTPRSSEHSVDLLVGQARVWNVRTKEFEDVHIMMDTGADQSFITRNYADHLGLGKTGQLQLTIHTFGNSSPTEQSCETTQVEIQHNFELAETYYITGDVKRTELHHEDRQVSADQYPAINFATDSRPCELPFYWLWRSLHVVLLAITYQCATKECRRNEPSSGNSVISKIEITWSLKGTVCS
ncbi:zinc knuckle [Ostertagia ostertagi]